MINRLLLILAFQCLFLTALFSAPKSTLGHLSMSGYLKGKSSEQVHLQVIYYPNFLTDRDEDRVILNLAVNEQGYFSFRIPVQGSIKFKLIDSISRKIVLPVFNQVSEFQVGFADDSVVFDIEMSEGNVKIVNTRGVGFERYQNVNLKDGYSLNHLNIGIRNYISMIACDIDSSRANNLSKDSVFMNYILADRYGKLFANFSLSKFGRLFLRFNDDQNIDYNILNSDSIKRFNQLMDSFIVSRIPNYSSSYEMIKLYYQNCFLEYLAEKKGGKLIYSEFANKFTNFAGSDINDKLICYAYLNGDAAAYFGADPYDYKESLNRAIKTIKDSSYVSRLKRIFNTRTIGSKVDFPVLPMDSSGIMFTLEQIKGKVVFVDMWSYQCGGCAHFAKAFHTGIYEKLKGDTNFVVVSVMVDGKAGREQYMKRLRREGTKETDGYDFSYTFTDYINLYAGKEYREEAEDIDRFWDIYRSPYTFLIGKSGRLYSSTLPYFDNPESDDCRTLLLLINRALEE